MQVAVFIITDNVLFRIEVLESEPKDDSGDKPDNRWTSKGPNYLRVMNGWGSREVDSVLNGGHEAIDGGYKTPHILGSTGIGDAVGCDVD